MALTWVVTNRTSEVLADAVPVELPVTETVAIPRAAEAPAANVSTLVPVVGFGLNDAVTPLGRLDATRNTLPVSAPAPVTVTVLAPDAP